MRKASEVQFSVAEVQLGVAEAQLGVSEVELCVLPQIKRITGGFFSH